jgi:hypothetical protein
MRFKLGIVAVVCLFLFVDEEAVQSQNYDVGVIEEMTEDNIYVRGNLGLHVLETVRACLWCQVGLEVLVTFEGFTRAKLSPYSENVRGRPLRVFVVRDGREED